MARTRTFPRRKVFRVSTPTLLATSRINRGYEESSKEHYELPCPHCGAYQWLKFSQLEWPKGAPALAMYKCEKCAQLINEHHKTQMLKAGIWIAERPELRDKHRGFHLSSLYSPIGWFTWADAAEMFERAKQDPLLLKVFVNTVLGETWEERGESPEWQRLYDRREEYALGTVPLGGLLLTSGVDVQPDRIEVHTLAWGRNKESWLVDYTILRGDVSRDEVWSELTAFLGTTFPHALGSDMRIRKLAIDSGAATQRVYGWARKHQQGVVAVIKGGPDSSPLVVGRANPVDVTVGGQTLKGGITVSLIAVGQLKGELYGYLQQEQYARQRRRSRLATTTRRRWTRSTSNS